MSQADLFKIKGTPNKLLQLLDAMHVADKDRWIPRRLLLLNYWMFDELEEFHFGRGNLLLTGKNESGKSTVLATALTLVLDSMLAPSRIDTAGKSGKSIRYYLVGEDDATEEHAFYRRERTAYVCLEFELGHSGKFLTIGVGLRSSRDWANRKVDHWAFLIQDGSRVGFTLDLIDPRNSQPLSASRLTDALKNRGIVYTDHSEYRKAVNEALFKFQEVDDYERLLELLQTVRTPRLGQGLSPEKVEQLLKSALPPVDTKAIESASEIFTKIDTIERQLRRLGDQLAVATELDELQSRAANARAVTAGLDLIDASKQHGIVRGKADAKKNDLEQKQREIVALAAKCQEFEAEAARVRGPLEIDERLFSEHAAFDVERELSGAQKRLSDAERIHRDLLADRRRAQATSEQYHARLQSLEANWDRDRSTFAQRVAALKSAAEEALWFQLGKRAEDVLALARTLSIREQDDPASDLVAGTIGPDVAERRRVLDKVIGQLTKLAEARGRVITAQADVQRAQKEFEQADTDHRIAHDAVESGRESALTAVTRWAASCTEFRVPEPAMTLLLNAVRDYQDGQRLVTTLVEPVLSYHAQAAAALAEERGNYRAEEKRLRAQVVDLRERIARLEDDEFAHPDRTEERVRARTLLLEAGIPHVPLFEACDFAPDVAADVQLSARIEAALEASGLLDALVLPAEQVADAREFLLSFGVSDSWIAPHATMGKTNNWFEPIGLPAIPEPDVRAVLEAVSAKSVVSEDGSWQVGPLCGTADAANDKVRFIGETNRRRERERRLAEARAVLQDTEQQLTTIVTAILDLGEREASLQNDLRRLEQNSELDALRSALRRREEASAERGKRHRNWETLVERLEELRRAVSEEQSRLDRETAQAPYLTGRSADQLATIRAALSRVEELANDAVRDARRLGEQRKDYHQQRELIGNIAEVIRDLGPRIQEAETLLQTAESAVEHLEIKLSQEAEGRDDLRARIDRARRQIQHCEKELDQLGKARLKAETLVGPLQETVTDLEDQLRSTQIIFSEKETAFLARLSEYPTLEGMHLDARDPAFGPVRVAHDLVGTTSAEAAGREAADSTAALLQRFYATQGVFSDLGPTIEDGVVYFSHPDRRMRANELMLSLEGEVASKQALLEENDRDLIEKVILREVVDSIRQAIQKTREWEKGVNDLLGDMDLFRGRVLRLHWHPRKKESADSFDPARLDDLLKQRGIALADQKRAELIDIFKTMLDDVRRKVRDSDQAVDYTTELKALVDYTRWYNLTIQRRDETGRFKDLTRRMHEQGSVGRMTLDLVLPLIAAVYARYAGAHYAAPRMIGLDEAFAGVDDQNAAEIYRLLSRLEFCWVMATEKATGTGEAIPGSVIYEFINDGGMVAPICSVWDGKRRHEFDESLMAHVAVTDHAASYAGG